MPNKLTMYAIISAFWLSFLAIVGVNLLGGIVMPKGEHVETAGYPIEAAEEEGAAVSVQEEEKRPNIVPLIATASAEDGAGVFRKCGSCHNTDAGGGHMQGPNLHNVVGAQVAANAGFGRYSDSLKEVGDAWTYEKLDDYLESPKRLAPRGLMSFAGLRKPADRAAVIKFLMSQTDNPPPLPEVVEEAPAEDTPAEAP